MHFPSLVYVLPLLTPAFASPAQLKPDNVKAVLAPRTTPPPTPPITYHVKDFHIKANGDSVGFKIQSTQTRDGDRQFSTVECFKYDKSGSEDAFIHGKCGPQQEIDFTLSLVDGFYTLKVTNHWIRVMPTEKFYYKDVASHFFGDVAATSFNMKAKAHFTDPF